MRYLTCVFFMGCGVVSFGETRQLPPVDAALVCDVDDSEIEADEPLFQVIRRTTCLTCHAAENWAPADDFRIWALVDSCAIAKQYLAFGRTIDAYSTLVDLDVPHPVKWAAESSEALLLLEFQGAPAEQPTAYDFEDFQDRINRLIDNPQRARTCSATACHGSGLIEGFVLQYNARRNTPGMQTNFASVTQHQAVLTFAATPHFGSESLPQNAYSLLEAYLFGSP